MWNESWTYGGMMDWADGAWYWLFSFHGILSLVSLTIVVVVGIALFRDWRRERMDRSDLAAPERE